MHIWQSRNERNSLRKWFGRQSGMLSGNVRFTEMQTIALLTLLFWVGTYCVFSIRSVFFPPIDVDMISLKRVLTTSVGAMLFFVALMVTRRSSYGDGRSLWLILSSAVIACAVLLLFRLAFNGLTEPDSFGVTDHGRWVLVWGGYFLGGLALFSPEGRAAVPSTPTLSLLPQISAISQVIWVQRNGGSVKLPVSDIEWMEAQGNYVYVHGAQTGGLVRRSLSSLEDMLQPNGFIRVHRSALCQTCHIQSLKRAHGGALFVVLTSGAELPVGRCYMANVTAIMSH